LALSSRKGSQHAQNSGTQGKRTTLALYMNVTDQKKRFIYRIVDRHFPEFITYIAVKGKSLPHHIQQEFDNYLKCGGLEHGFLRVPALTAIMSIWLLSVVPTVGALGERRGFCPNCGARCMAQG